MQLKSGNRGQQCLVCSKCDHPLLATSDLYTRRLPLHSNMPVNQDEMMGTKGTSNEKSSFAYEFDDLVNDGAEGSCEEKTCWVYSCEGRSTCSLELNKAELAKLLPADKVVAQTKRAIQFAKENGIGRLSDGAELPEPFRNVEEYSMEACLSSLEQRVPSKISDRRVDLVMVPLKSVVGTGVVVETDRKRERLEGSGAIVGNTASAGGNVEPTTSADGDSHSPELRFANVRTAEEGDDWLAPTALRGSQCSCAVCGTCVGYVFCVTDPETIQHIQTDHGITNDDQVESHTEEPEESSKSHPALVELVGIILRHVKQRSFGFRDFQKSVVVAQHRLHLLLKALDQLDTDAVQRGPNHSETDTQMMDDDRRSEGVLQPNTAEATTDNVGAILLQQLQRIRSAALPLSRSNNVGLSGGGGGGGGLTQQEVNQQISAYRLQADLLSNLLEKHKEQNAVQGQLLDGQRERIRAQDEKLSTMQQICDAQREQMHIHATHVRHQESLISGHKEQSKQLHRQIEVEQLLISEQNKTIEAQTRRIRLLMDQVRTTDEFVQNLQAREIHEIPKCAQHSTTLPGTGTAVVSTNTNENQYDSEFEEESGSD